MQGFLERARQALGVGPDAFLPSNLDAQAATVNELDVFGPNLRDMLKATQAFADNTNRYLESTAAYITDAPFPQLWMQGSPSEPATTTQMPVPAAHAAWFDAGVAVHEAAIVPAAVGCALRAELVAPMEQWLWAYQVAQGQLSELEGKRLAYDAERRRLVQHATAATSTPPSAAAPAVEDPALAQLAEDAAAVNAHLSEFESDVEALDDLLHWLVEGAVRLKALLADTAGGMGVAADSWTTPPGIMPPFPDKSTFGEDLEVTVKNVPDAPGGPEQVVASSTAMSASEASGVTTVASFTPYSKSHTGLAPTGSAAGGTPAQPQPDLSKLLPADEAMVYGGGVEPPKSDAARPGGGGVGQLMKDTLVGPAAPADTHSPQATAAAAAAGAAPGGDSAGVGRAEGRSAASAVDPDLSKILPADDAMVYGGGVAPAAGTGMAAPLGGGVGQMVKDTLLTPTAPKVSSRSAHSYSGQGTGRVEARMTDAAAAGLGSAQPRVGRSRSADSPAESAATVGKSGASFMRHEASTSVKQLAIVPSLATSSAAATATRAAAAPEAAGIDPSSPAADTKGMVGLHPPQPADTADTVTETVSALDDDQTSPADAAAPTDADGGGSSSSATGQAGGIWAAVKRTAAVAGSAAATAGSVAAAAASAALHAVPVPGITHEGFGSQPASEADDDEDLGADVAEAAAESAAAAGTAAEQGAGGKGTALHSHPLAARPEGGSDQEGATTQAAPADPSAAAAAAAAAAVCSGVDAGALVGSQLEPGPHEVKAAQQQGGEHAEQSGAAEQGSSSGEGATISDVKAMWTGEVVEAFQQEKYAGEPPAGTTTRLDHSSWMAGFTLPGGSAATPAPSSDDIKDTAHRVRESLSTWSEATGGDSSTGAEAPVNLGPVALPEADAVKTATTESARAEEWHLRRGPAPSNSDPTAPAPNKAFWVKDTPTAVGSMETSDTAAPRDQEQGRMHIVTPPSGPSEPAHGSATWAKGPTAPGGAAAGNVHVRDKTGGFKDADVAQGRMHIGPVLDSSDPSDLPQGGPIWAKGPTPPGGAAAAAPAGSSADTDMERGTQQGIHKPALDLSKVLPTYEHGVPEAHSKPEGGSFGAFIKDTLLGPKRE